MYRYGNKVLATVTTRCRMLETNFFVAHSYQNKLRVHVHTEFSWKVKMETVATDASTAFIIIA